MIIENTVHRLPARKRHDWLSSIAPAFATRLAQHTYPLRFAVVDVTHDDVVLEATVLNYGAENTFAARLGQAAITAPRRKVFQASPFGVVHIVPTGIRCELGGFAGDACPATNLLAAVADVLVTHPNAVNASELNEMAPNVLYVEGKALDDFLLGHLGLLPVRSNFCVLKGLHRAPRLIPLATLNDVPAHLISLNNVGAIITPADCLGGIPALAAEFSDIPLIAVKENTTILHVTNDLMRMPNVIAVNSYLEAAGVVVALREGIALESLRRPLHTAQRLDLSQRYREEACYASRPADHPLPALP